MGVPEGDIDQTGLSDVESMDDPKDRWQTGNLDEEDAPLVVSLESPRTG
jgi:hypothetical protein